LAGGPPCTPRRRTRRPPPPSFAGVRQLIGGGCPVGSARDPRRIQRKIRRRSPPPTSPARPLAPPFSHCGNPPPCEISSKGVTVSPPCTARPPDVTATLTHLQKKSKAHQFAPFASVNPQRLAALINPNGAPFLDNNAAVYRRRLSAACTPAVLFFSVF